MNDTTSSAQIPYKLYVERCADDQLKKIIDGMARPGYVLVARQMGKTNLLLHTKEKYQTEKEIYVYIDFSTMSEFSERECLNHFIDTAIEVNWKLFEEAEVEIELLRQKPGYRPSRMFSRELRILLKYADRIVFILDEIDALTRREYSDNIFSLIRGHYFASTNFPDLKKATFILSGVIEPKDIIKDHNISPFNIGEKIYLLDFTYDEFKRLVSNFEFLRKIPETSIQRLYHWTKGQPRMSWDLCNAANSQRVQSIEDIDEIVSNLYLKAFDMAPIDSIREMVSNDPALRDAVIQLAINKGDTLSPQVKSRLYLAGIINWEEGTHNFKNPIMAKSLSYDWLIQLQSKELNFLVEAEKSIELDMEYRKGISMLKRFIDTSPKPEEYAKAVYYLSLAYYKLEDYSESIKWQELISPESSFYFQGLLLKAFNLTAQQKIELSNEILNEILKNEGGLDIETYLRSVLSLITNDIFIIESNFVDDSISNEYIALLDRDNRLIASILAKYVKEITQLQMYAVFLYYRSLIYYLKGEISNSVDSLDIALIFATNNEKPWLLYRKLILSPEKYRKDIASKLYESLNGLTHKKISLDSNNIIELNRWNVSEILAVLMLDYPYMDVSPLLRAFWVESKENALILVYNILQDKKYYRSNDLLMLILRLVNEENWLFNLENEIVLAVNAFNHLNDDTYAFNLIEKHLVGGSFNNQIVNLIAWMTEKFKNQNSPITILKLVDKYKSNIKGTDLYSQSDVIIRANECWAKLSLDMEIEFIHDATQLIDIIKKRSNSDDDSFLMRNTTEKITKIRQDLELKISEIKRKIKSISSLNKTLCNRLDRNRKMIVYSLRNGQVEEGKFKNLKSDLLMGYCRILKIQK